MSSRLRGGKHQLNWSRCTYCVMHICDEFNPKTNEYYEFEDHYNPKIPTHQLGIAGTALVQAYEKMPHTFEEYLKSDGNNKIRISRRSRV